MTNRNEPQQDSNTVGMNCAYWAEFERVILRLRADPEFDSWMRCQDSTTFGSKEFWREFADVASRRWRELDLGTPQM